MYFCPFMSSPTNKFYCTTQCALCVNGNCIIRTNAMLNEDTKTEVRQLNAEVQRLRTTINHLVQNLTK